METFPIRLSKDLSFTFPEMSRVILMKEFPGECQSDRNIQMELTIASVFSI